MGTKATQGAVLPPDFQGGAVILGAVRPPGISGGKDIPLGNSGVSVIPFQEGCMASLATLAIYSEGQWHTLGHGCANVFLHHNEKDCKTA